MKCKAPNCTKKAKVAGAFCFRHAKDFERPTLHKLEKLYRPTADAQSPAYRKRLRNMCVWIGLCEGDVSTVQALSLKVFGDPHVMKEVRAPKITRSKH